MALANANGEKYSEALISQNTPVAPAQMMAQAQAALARGDTATASVILGQLHKDQYIAPATFRGGSYSQDQNTGLTTYHAALPEGSQPTMNADGSVASVAPIPGAAGVESAMAGAKAGATAAATTPYQLTQVLGPDGNYHSVPVSSLTGGAPGAGPTASGGLNGFYGHASQGGTPVPAGYTPAPAGNVTGLGPGQQSATTTAGKNSANAFQGAIDGGNNAKNAMRGIDNILTAATGLQTGTGAGAISEFKSGMNVVLPKSMQFDTRNIAAFDEIKKNAASLGDQLSQSIGGGTDSRLKNALDSLPNANYSPAAIQEVGLNLKALQSAALGRAQAAAAWQQSHGAESYPAFQQAWQNAYNPDVFYYMQKGPQAFQKWAGSMSAPARAKALDQYRTMKTLGAF
ncbi:hypothetical protein [Novosphingobium sp.]|uniref:hypothetical protein n=1 Tax=Novosphingobium sp. TaxID=1874826 RepID=UPI003D0EB740